MKLQAFDFLNQLRAEPTAWQVCISLFTRFPRASDVVRHTALEFINNAIQNQQLDAQSLITLRDTLLVHVRQVYGGFDGGVDIDSPSVRNKLTQTITYLFELLYANGWETFFEDFYSLAKLGQQPTTEFNPPALVLYLRLLSSIHDEIADVLVPRTSEQQKTSNQLKDYIRQRDAQKVALSWQEVLSRWREEREEVIDLCLKVVSHWVSWTDISLVANEALLTPLFQLVVKQDIPAGNSEDKVRNSAIDTVTEIVAKKMKPADKIEMIGFLNLGNMIAQLISSPPLHRLQATSTYDTDMAEAVAKLVSTAACDIVRALEPEVTDEGTRQRANELLRLFVPWVLRFFSDEYDEVSSTVIPFLNDLLALFRKEMKSKDSLSSQHQSMLSPILNAIILKMKYDETTSWANEDEQTEEAEFQDLRKRLQVLQQAVAAVDETLYVEVISNVVNNIFGKMAQQGSQVDWRDLDLALYEMYLFGEFVVKSGGLYSKGQPTNTAAETLTRMMANMIQSGTFVCASHYFTSY